VDIDAADTLRFDRSIAKQYFDTFDISSITNDAIILVYVCVCFICQQMRRVTQNNDISVKKQVCLVNYIYKTQLIRLKGSNFLL